MSFDTSRFGFHPWNDYLGVVMQQGRVQIDADWNEWVAQLGRRLQAGTLDTVGRAVVPRTTPEGFHILANGGAVSIGMGRMYVDGLLAENHGAEPTQWETRLAELGGTGPVPLLEQPYLPYNTSNQPAPASAFNPPDLSGGPHLFYLDVWQREVTHWQAPDLVEKAVGVDTTGRLQTVWQVRVLRNIANTTCATPDAEVPGWAALTAPSGGRLSNATATVPGDVSPCLVPPAAGYKGLENQLYRVEIHRGGPQATATFKWSRDNATVATRVSEIQGGNRLVVESIGRDDVLGFHGGEWIEVLDDWHELHGLPGRLHRILPGSGVDAATRSITLETALPADLFPVDGQGLTDPERHTRIRRWDQSASVRREDGTAFHNLDASGVSDGIPLPPPGTRLALENGILVDFSVVAGGQFRAGDHWVFAARTVDGSIEPLTDAPPRGIHHHYARLAVVTLPDTETDCRVFWPPEVGGESCDCTVCVHPTEHNNGTATIQQAIDAVRARGGGTVCLDVGTYVLRAPLNLENLRSLRLRGQGWRSVLQPAEAGAAINASRAIGLTIENLSIVGMVTGGGTTALVNIAQSVDVALEHLTLAAGATADARSAGIAFSGLLLAARVKDCVIAAEQCIVSAAGAQQYLLSAQLHITDNVLLGGERAVNLGGLSLHTTQTRIAHNLILGCSQVGVALTGAALPSASVVVEGNVMQVSGVGVMGGTDRLRIENNDITAVAGRLPADGIAIQQGLDQGTLDGLVIAGNRLRRQRGHGIAIGRALGQATIRSNTIDNTIGGAIVMAPEASAACLDITDNRFTNIGAGFNSNQLPFFGVLLLSVARADVAGNVWDGLARQALVSPLRCALLALACGEVRVADNRLYGIGPSSTFTQRVIGLAVGPGFHHVAVQNNNVARRASETEAVSVGNWQPLLILGGGTAPTETATMVAPTVAPMAVPGVVILPLPNGNAMLSGNRLTALSPNPGSVQVHGNRLRGDTSLVPATQIMVVQSCQFAQNDIHITGGDSAGLLAGVVVAEHASVANNRLVSDSGDNIFLLFTTQGQFAVLGNLASGTIRANGAALPAPWDVLNVTI